MDHLQARKIGRTDLAVPVLGMGMCPLGDLFEEVPEEVSRRTLDAAWEAGIRLYDTAPWYGLGQGEHRLGRALYRKPRADYVLSTKVGRRLIAPRDRAGFRHIAWSGGLAFDHVHDYTYDGIMRSYEDSLQRLGINKVDILFIHDLDTQHFPDPDDLAAKFRELETGGFRALDELKDAGEIAAIGTGLNERGTINAFLDRHPMDVVLVASRYTLLDQDILADELPRLRDAGGSVIIGGAFNSGILATGAVAGARYEYAGAPPDIVDRVRRIDAVARRHGVPLPAAALQFPFGFEAVASVVSGPSRPHEITMNVGYFNHPIPDDFWAELKAERLLPHHVPTPSSGRKEHAHLQSRRTS
ncbi:MAG: aldo/keto reductase [Rhizobiales bacterium]|nr:aldo/keto reductase [Hyphomicrobiales bacterium]